MTCNNDIIHSVHKIPFQHSLLGDFLLFNWDSQIRVLPTPLDYFQYCISDMVYIHLKNSDSLKKIYMKKWEEPSSKYKRKEQKDEG